MKKEVSSLRVTVPGTGSAEKDIERLQLLAVKFNEMNLDIVTSEDKLGSHTLRIIIEPHDQDADIKQDDLETAATIVNAAFLPENNL